MEYDNEIADTFSKAFYFDDWLDEDNFQLFDRKWNPYNYNLFADCYNNKLQFHFLQILKTKGKVGYCFDWSVGNNWFVTSVYLIAIIIKLLVLCKERCKYSYCYEATDCNITHIIKLKHTCIFGEVSRFCQE